MKIAIVALVSVLSITSYADDDSFVGKIFENTTNIKCTLGYQNGDFSSIQLPVKLAGSYEMARGRTLYTDKNPHMSGSTFVETTNKGENIVVQVATGDCVEGACFVVELQYEDNGEKISEFGKRIYEGRQSTKFVGPVIEIKKEFKRVSLGNCLLD